MTAWDDYRIGDPSPMAKLDAFPETERKELAWWRQFHATLVPGTDLPAIGSDLGPYKYRVSRAGFKDA